MIDSRRVAAAAGTWIFGLAMYAAADRAWAVDPAAPLATLEAYSGKLDESEQPVRDLIARYAQDEQFLRRQQGAGGGAERLAERESFGRRWLAALESLDFDTLTLDGRIDYVLLTNHLQRELREVEHQRRRNEEVRDLLPFAQRVHELERDRRQLSPIAARDLAARVDGLAEEIETLKGRIESGELTASVSVAYRATQRLKDVRAELEGWYTFYAGYDPSFTWWLQRPYARLTEAWNEYARLVHEQLVLQGKLGSDPVVGDPIGREALLDALKFEMIPYTPEELIEIAEREFAWCEAEYRRAAREMGHGDDWRAALEEVKRAHVEPGDQPLLIQELADEAVAFLDERELVTIPDMCKDGWRMEMMTAERQRVNPYFTGGEVISVSFPTAEMEHADKLMSLRGNNRHFARATVHHELIPGHHLQLYMADRQRAYRQLFSTPFYVEGWALHWEMLLWDLDFAKSPEDRIGMLFWRSHRCARILFSLQYHLGKMSADECIDFLVDRVGHERRNATAEVRRSVEGSYSPLYQAAYMLGGLQLRSLYGDLVLRGDWTPRQFHDAVLAENMIPIEMIRARLLQSPPARNFVPSWRF